MKKIFDILSAHKHAIIWTICYTGIMWCVLYFLFKFNMFDISMWQRLFRAQLHGFPGFVFGILLLAALPLYIATTTLIIRNKKSLITIPLPKINIKKILALFEPTPIPTPVEPTPPTTSETPELGPDAVDIPTELPPDMPAELRNAYIRARSNLGQMQTSIFNTPRTPAPVIDETTNDLTTNEFPLPSDFDIPVEIPATEFTSAPTFTDITFGDNVPSTETPTSQSDKSTFDDLTQHLSNSGRTFKIADNIVITDTHAIITHSDPDFWVADSDNWFAAGKTCPSPIIAVQDASIAHNVLPAIYLASNNIMDLDNLINDWTEKGITVFTSLDEI